MTTKDNPPKKSKEELLEIALKLEENIKNNEEKIAIMEAKKAKALSGKENKEGEKEESTTPENKEPEKINKDEELRREYYDKALEIITRTGDTTFSNLMRKLKISVGKAKRLLEIFEQDGILGPSIKGSPREILKKDPNHKENKAEEGYKAGDEIEFTEEGIKKIETEGKENKEESDAEKIIRLRAEAKAELEEKENTDKGKESSRYNFLWQEVRGDSDLAYTYKEGIFPFEINGKETEVTVYENKTEWKKHSVLWKITRLKLKEEEIFKERPTWVTYVITENNELDEKYPKEYEFETKEEAMAFAEKIIDDGMKIKYKTDQNPSDKIKILNTFPPYAYVPETKPTSQEPIAPETNPKPTPVTPEKMKSYEEIMQKAEEERLSLLQNGPQSLRVKNGVLNAIKGWEKFGIEQKNEKGEIIKEGVLWKRLTKMAVNLALIGAISCVSIDQFAKQTSAISASALGGSVTTAWIRKLGIGLGIGSIMELSGSKIPPKVRKWIPVAMGLASVGVATGLAGVFVPAAALATGASIGAGYISTKFIKGWSTDEKIAKKKEEQIENLVKKYTETTGEMTEKNLENFEKDYIKLLKNFENRTIIGKIADEGAKILAGSIVSGVALELSGLAHDHNLKTDLEKEIAEAQSEHEKAIQRLDELKEQHEESLERLDALDKQHQQSVEDLKEQQTEQNKSDIKLENIIVHKGEGIEHSFIRQIEHNSELAKELGYKGDVDDTKALHEFAGRQAHVIAIKTGYVDNQGHEIRISEADKIGYEIKMENGHVTVIEKTSTGEIVETHNEGDKFEDKIEKGEYIKDVNPKTGVDTTVSPDSNNTPIDTSHTQGDNVNHQGASEIIGAQEKPEIIDVHRVNEDTEGYKPPERILREDGGPNQHGDTSKTISGENDSGNVITEKDLTPAEIKHVHNVFDRNIDHLFRGRPDGEWNSIQKLIPADRILELYNKGEVESYFKPLVHHMMKLEEITGLHPYSYDPIFHPEGPESIPVFIGRALEEAARIGKLDEVTL